MNKNDALGNRMKTYENITRNYLTRRMPVIIRCDGKAFHTFTRGFKKPFDDIFVKSMQDTMKYLCENIQDCVLGYTQSDEITLVLVDYQNRDTSAWFDNNIQKMVSVSASMATLAFNRAFVKNIDNEIMEYRSSFVPQSVEIQQRIKLYHDTLKKSAEKGAMFDSRVFNIPKEEVVNCLIWRQQDATRNSIQSVGQANFSHKQLDGKNCSDIQDMLMTENDINWNDYPTHLKRGSCCIKEDYFIPSENGKGIRFPEGCSDPFTDDEIEKGTWRTRWVIDNEIPIFTQNKDYINKLIFI